MNFQQIVLTVALVIFCIILVIIVTMLNNAKNKSKFPPELSICPDWWEYDMTNKKCINPKNLGTSNTNCGENHFNSSIMNENIKVKKDWAKNCKILWDGVWDGSSN